MSTQGRGKHNAFIEAGQVIYMRATSRACRCLEFIIFSLFWTARQRSLVQIHFFNYSWEKTPVNTLFLPSALFIHVLTRNKRLLKCEAASMTLTPPVWVNTETQHGKPTSGWFLLPGVTTALHRREGTHPWHGLVLLHCLPPIANASLRWVNGHRVPVV